MPTPLKRIEAALAIVAEHKEFTAWAGPRLATTATITPADVRALIEDRAKLRKTVEMCHYELVTLHPRLTEPYQTSVRSCIDVAGGVIEETK